MEGFCDAVIRVREDSVGVDYPVPIDRVRRGREEQMAFSFVSADGAIIDSHKEADW